MGRISLCVIAKNEAAMLPGMFASVVGAVDEIVFVDTGSTDETVRIAQAAGARVIHHRWQDDFADARNRAVVEASGEWVLVLDCDERLAPGAREALRNAVERGGFELGLLPLYNATRSDASAEEILSGVAGKGAPTLLPRLMRRDPELRWEGRIHESVTGWLAKGTKRVQQVDASILHLGNAEDVLQAKDKTQRDLALLERRCQEEPDNPVMWSHLARVYVRAHRTEDAWRAAGSGWQAVERIAQSGGGHNYSLSPLVTVFCFLALQRGDSQVALKVLLKAAQLGIVHPNLQLLKGIAMETQALSANDQRMTLLRQATTAFAHAIKMGSQTWTEDCMPGATGWAAYTRLGTVLLLQDEWAVAEESFRAALGERPEHTEAQLGLAEALLGQNEYAEALSILEPILQEASSDAWILCAFACRNMGQIEDTKRFVVLAVQHIESGLYAPHRRNYLVMLQQDLVAMAG